MPFLTHICPECKKPAEVLLETSVKGTKLYVYKCGHLEKLVGLEEISTEALDNIESLDHKRLYNFQKSGAIFAETANLKCLIADEPGVGKTLQALAAIITHPKEAEPFIVFCKSGLKPQWTHEIIRWCGPSYVPQTIESSRDNLYPGFKAYICSLDMLRLLNVKVVQRLCSKCEEPWQDGWQFCPKCQCAYAHEKRVPSKFESQLLALGVKTIIIDECQLIKNTESKRTVAVRELCRRIPNVIALSGTPIKNNAAEYFSILNILRPEKFKTYVGYIQRWCDTYWDGNRQKIGGLRDPESFKEYTKDFIIRRTRSEVLPDLPKVTRNFQFHELGKEVEQAYIQEVTNFIHDETVQQMNGSSGFAIATNRLAALSRMRHLTGLSKIDPCIDFLMEYIGGTTRKIVVFLHHKDVNAILHQKLDNLLKELELPGVLQLTADLDASARNDVVMEFMDGPERVMLASTLASGEGLNLQFCSDCILLERQWNPANEEQAEARFIRIGQLESKVMATYFVALGTVDEFFSELVEHKRSIMANTLDGKDVKWDESSLMRELTEILMTKGLKKWR